MVKLQIKTFIDAVGECNSAHGIYGNINDPREYLAHIHSEVSEAYEELRKGNAPGTVYRTGDGKPQGVPVELADVVLSCFGMAYLYGIDLAGAIQEKFEYDRHRPYKHGKEL